MKLAVVVLALICSAVRGSSALPLDVPEFDFTVFRAQVMRAMDTGLTNEALDRVQRGVKERPTLFKMRALLGEVHEKRGESAQAIKAYDIALALDPDADALHQRRGECHFRLGQLEEALADFDALLARNPKDAPWHWQRGIVLYDLGRYAEGRKQFESHQTVNGADCETALWHWLCVARQSGTNAAVQALIPFDTADVRPPMKQLHALYAGQGSVDAVLTAVEQPPTAEQELSEPVRLQLSRMARFYGYLYLGLHAEALGEKAKSLEWLRKAVEHSEGMERMADVARVHLRLRSLKP